MAIGNTILRMEIRCRKVVGLLFSPTIGLVVGTREDAIVAMVMFWMNSVFRIFWFEEVLGVEGFGHCG